ncbi:MAG: hypothetical protein HFE93_05005 [Acutalibacter muris]|jgi:hypothetical protein|nr:hypothetical protein [Acutalibacter muris]
MNTVGILLSLGKSLEVWQVPSGNIAVAYQDCDLKEGQFLIAVFGTGKTFEDACEDYMNKLHGKTLVFNAYTDRREEIKVL